MSARDIGFSWDQSDLRGAGFDSRTIVSGNYLIFNDDGTLDFASNPLCGGRGYGRTVVDDFMRNVVFPDVDEFLSSEVCRYDGLADYRVMKENNRTGLYSGFDFPTGKHTIFGEAYINFRETEHEFAPTYPNPFPVVSEAHPNNPFDAPVLLFYAASDAGLRGTHNEWDLYQGVLGVRGRIGSWDYETAATLSYSEESRRFENRILIDEFEAALRGQGGPQGNAYYNPFGGAPNDPAVISEFTTDITDTIKADYFGFEAFASRGLFEWRYGSADIALGVEYRNHENRIRTDSPNRSVYGFFQIDESDYDRDVFAAFAELTLPLYQDLDLQIAGRFEDFSDFGSEFSPKFALRWQTNDYLVLRGSYSEAFKPPSFVELSGRPVTTFQFYVDPIRCMEPVDADLINECINGTFVDFIQQANPNLDPESGQSIVAGFVFSPPRLSDLALSVDYWQFDYEDRIDFVSSFGVSQFFPDDPRFVTRAPQTEEDIANGRPGAVTAITASYINFEKLKTRGYDAAVTWETGFRKLGDLKLDFRTTYFQHYEFTDSLSTNPGNRVGRGFPFELPRWRSNLIATWTLDDNLVTLGVNHVHSFTDNDNYFLPNRAIGTHMSVDLQYQRTFRRWNSAQFRVGCLDCFDQRAPRGEDGNPMITGFYDPRGQQLTTSFTLPF